jgi:hypothetical protein
VGIYVYYASGSYGLFSDYPVSGGPALNAAFKGARTIYNTSGNFYWAPMEIVNAEYGWNVRSTGFYDDPFTSGDGWRAWHRYIHQVNGPEQISGRGGIYARACDLLYGPKAGPIMAQYYMESVWLPDVAVKEPEGWNQYVNRFTYLPETWNRMYAVPMHYAHLMHDSNTWRLESSSPPVVGGVKLDRKELHRRLARRWRLMAGLNAKGADYIRRALAAGPLPDAVDDLRFLETSFRVYQPWIEALADFHSGLDLYLSTPRQPDRAGEQFAAALRKAREAQRLAAQAFPSSVDPAGGGEVGAVRFYIDRLVQAVETAVKLISRG